MLDYIKIYFVFCFTAIVFFGNIAKTEASYSIGPNCPAHQCPANTLACEIPYYQVNMGDVNLTQSNTFAISPTSMFPYMYVFGSSYLQNADDVQNGYSKTVKMSLSRYEKCGNLNIPIMCFCNPLGDGSRIDECPNVQTWDSAVFGENNLPYVNSPWLAANPTFTLYNNSRDDILYTTKPCKDIYVGIGSGYPFPNTGSRNIGGQGGTHWYYDPVPVLDSGLSIESNKVYDGKWYIQSRGNLSSPSILMVRCGEGCNTASGMAKCNDSVARSYIGTEAFPASGFCEVGTPNPNPPTNPQPDTPSNWTCGGDGLSSVNCQATRSNTATTEPKLVLLTQGKLACDTNTNKNPDPVCEFKARAEGLDKSKSYKVKFTYKEESETEYKNLCTTISFSTDGEVKCSVDKDRCLQVKTGDKTKVYSIRAEMGDAATITGEKSNGFCNFFNNILGIDIC